MNTFHKTNTLHKIKQFGPALTIFTVFAIVCFLGFPNHVGAVQADARDDALDAQIDTIVKTLELNLPEVWVLPDSPFYQLQLAFEDILLFFSSSDEERARLLLEFAQRRLAESLKLEERGEVELARETLDAFNQTLEQVTEILDDADTADITALSTELELRLKQYDLLEFVAGEYNVTWSRND